jgi:hypothetical protein
MGYNVFRPLRQYGERGILRDNLIYLIIEEVRDIVIIPVTDIFCDFIGGHNLCNGAEYSAFNIGVVFLASGKRCYTVLENDMDKVVSSIIAEIFRVVLIEPAPLCGHRIEFIEVPQHAIGLGFAHHNG